MGRVIFSTVATLFALALWAALVLFGAREALAAVGGAGESRDGDGHALLLDRAKDDQA